jgi:phosphate starvation-inducible PhoH-like protein
MAYAAFQQHDVLFMVGPAGTAKTHLSMAFAISEVLQRKKKKIILSRPIVEAGESLGYLPGDFEEKVNPYLLPLLDCLERLVGVGTPQRETIDRSIVIAPLAYMRGRTFNDSICILDEAQNATYIQLKLFLTRMGSNTKMIINGDMKQSDLREVALTGLVDRLQSIPGIGVVKFKKDSIVRNPLVSAILEALEE